MRTFPLPLLLAAAACSPGTIVTVQPNAIPTTAVEGEWYWRRTVEDAPYGTTATFVGAQDPLERVVFEIEEDLLVAYRSIPHIDGVGADRGAPVLVFPITDQFDIRRAYDHATGEESNVVEENREAPWYEREYVRVDFSMDLSGAGFTAAGQDLEIADWVTGDDRDADAPQLDDSDDDGVIDSLLVTQHALVSPATTFLPGWGDVPVCLFYGEAEYECDPSELSIVHSFVRTGQRGAYQGLAYDDAQFRTFGYFTSDRIEYDPSYGLLEQNRVRWANRHPLFERDLATDDTGTILCSVGRDEAPCTTFASDDDPVPVAIAYAERTVRPIVYHVGPGFPADLIPVMEEAARQWNEPLRDTVNGLREWECIDGGGKKKECDDLRDEKLDVFVFCPNNPSLPDDPDACNTDHTGVNGHPDGIPDPVRVGDLRYHLAHVIPYPQLASPFGYGPSAADPVGTRITLADGEDLVLGAGEIVSGNAFVYEHVLDRVSTQVADLVALLNGEITTDAFVAGEDVAAWVEAAQSGDVVALTGSTAGVPQDWTHALVEQRLDAISNGFAKLVAPQMGAIAKPTHPSGVTDFLEAAADAVEQSGAFGAGVAQTGAAWDEMLAGPYDDLAWSADTMAGWGLDPETTTDDALAARSPFDPISPDLAAERELGRVLAGQHAVDLDDGAFADSSLLGLARYYAELGYTRDEILQDVRENVFLEVMLHEIGHTLGLRHNFAGSADAFNYRKEYWDLRDDGDMGPRHLDPETDIEIDGRIRESQYSTVMDYPGSRNVAWAGLGHYDEAAVKFGYGQLVEVLTGLPTSPAIPGLPNEIGIAYIASYAQSNVLPSVLLWYNDGSMLELHYTDWPAIAGDLEARADVPLYHLAATLSETSTSFADGLAMVEAANGIDAGSPAVPYRFCSDEFAIGMICARFDEGADPYEAVSFLTERYWNDYVLTNFARQRYGFGDAGAYAQRLQDRTFEPLRTWQRYYALFHGLLDAESDPLVAEFFAADRGWGGWTAATDETLRFLTQVITRPEPGTHVEIVRPDGTRVLSPGTSEDDIPLVQGAYFESDWDYDSGYHWFENQSRIGTYFDRMLALVALTNTASYDFIGYDTAIDPRQYAIGFQDLYRDPLHTFIGRLMADEVGTFAPARAADGTLVYPDPLATDAVWPPAGAALVQPATYWLVRFDAALLGLSLMNHGYDRTFLDRARIYLEGSSSAVTPPAGQQTVSFVDPLGGGTFIAWSFPRLDENGVALLDPNGEIIELGAGACLLHKANHLTALCDGTVPAEDPAAACAEMERMTSDLHLVAEMYADIAG